MLPFSVSLTILGTLAFVGAILALHKWAPPKVEWTAFWSLVGLCALTCVAVVVWALASAVAALI